jgi:hypothetical protein
MENKKKASYYDEDKSKKILALFDDEEPTKFSWDVNNEVDYEAYYEQRHIINPDVTKSELASDRVLGLIDYLKEEQTLNDKIDNSKKIAELEELLAKLKQFNQDRLKKFRKTNSEKLKKMLKSDKYTDDDKCVITEILKDRGQLTIKSRFKYSWEKSETENPTGQVNFDDCHEPPEF